MEDEEEIFEQHIKPLSRIQLAKISKMIAEEQKRRFIKDNGGR